LPRHFVSVTGFADQLVLRELPFEVPPVHVDMLWHRRVQQDSAHQWLRGVIAQLPQRQRPGMPSPTPVPPKPDVRGQ
jgi:DNA-binding transcriptional LysR family regulator